LGLELCLRYGCCCKKFMSDSVTQLVIVIPIATRKDYYHTQLYCNIAHKLARVVELLALSWRGTL
jgi:hypothetical protein